jgi:hypothetical protein
MLASHIVASAISDMKKVNLDMIVSQQDAFGWLK